MKLTKIQFLTTILLFSINITLGQTAVNNSSQLNDRVKALEDYKTNIDNLSKAQSESLKIYVDNQVKKGIEEIEDSKRIISWVLFLGLPVTLISMIGVYIAAIRKAKKIVVDKIETIVEGKRDEIIRLIETEEFDTKLRGTKELLVISGDEESEKDFKKFMSKLKFKNVKYRRFDSIGTIPEHDLMIFNTPDDNLSQEIIDSLIEATADEDTCYVAYTTKPLKRDPRLNFSNSPFTLYHSILSTLKFAEIAKLAD